MSAAAARPPRGGQGQGPLPQAGRGPRHRARPRQQAVQQAAVGAEVRRGQDRHLALAD